MSEKTKINLTTVLLLLALIILCIYQLYDRPGFHFDEAWAANYALRIAEEPGFWPWQGMSPYTSPWTHYLAAVFFKVFGVGLLEFRVSQVLLSFVGLAFFSLSLEKIPFAPKSRNAFFLLCLLSPGLWLNFRFAIEVNGFLVACLGIFFWLWADRRETLCLWVWFIGTTSHILFYPVGLSFLLWQASRQEPLPWKRGHLVALFFLFFGFFLRVAVSVPEKGKAYALLFSTLGILFLGFSWAQSLWWKFLALFPKRTYLALWLLLIPFLLNLIFFAQGQWTYALQTGYWHLSFFHGFFWILYWIVLSYLAFQGLKLRGLHRIHPEVLLTVLMGLMMLKATPRYYTLPMIVFFGFAAMGLSVKKKWIYVCLPLLFHSFYLGWQFQRTVPIYSAFQFLAWKDSSKDFMNKQLLVKVLGNCQMSDIESVDFRIRGALLFLARRDWPKPLAKAKCDFPSLVILSPDDPAVMARKRRVRLAGWNLWAP